MTATNIQPGDDLHLTSLMAPHSLNLVTGPDRAALLAFGRDVFAAARDSKCLAQIEEPAKPVAEICSASHDDAQFGERTIKPLCDISGFEYGTPLYAGAAPAAVAPQGVVAWMHPETLHVISAAHKHDMSTEYGAETRRKAESYSVALVRAGEPAAAPALEAPAAPAGWKLVPEKPTDAMLGAAQKAWLADPLRRSSTVYAAALAAAPQAPAAPSAVATQVVESLLQLARIVNTAVEDWGESFEDGSSEVTFHKEEADKLEEILEFFDSLPDAPPEEGVILSGPSRAARVLRAMAAPAAPAVDAQGERDAAFEAVRQRLCRIPRWSFHIDSRGNIRRVDDARGNWIEFSAAHELFDPVVVDAAIAAQAAAKGEHAS